MIDSIAKVDLPAKDTKCRQSNYVQWMVSAGRDRNIVLWKLFDGKPIKKRPKFYAKTKSKDLLKGGRGSHRSAALMSEKAPGSNPLSPSGSDPWQDLDDEECEEEDQEESEESK